MPPRAAAAWKALQVHAIPGAGRAPREGCRHIGGRYRNEKGRGRGAGAFLARVRSGCGAGARHLAVVACRRSGCRFQGKGMNEHMVANVARWDRPVENWRHRFCSRAPLSLLSLEANAAVANVDGRHQLTSGFVGLRFCLAVVTPGGNDKPSVPRSTMVRGLAVPRARARSLSRA